MRLLLTTTSNNDRSPRYMEKALATMHQSGLDHEAITLIYGEVTGQVGLMICCSKSQREFVVGPIEANYPQCSVTEVAESPNPPSDWQTWSVSLDLSPEIYPILRHAQFEDLLNRAFADPSSSLLRAIRPDDTLHARVEITIRPASHRRCHDAREAVRRLDREFFRHHHRLSAYFANSLLIGLELIENDSSSIHNYLDKLDQMCYFVQIVRELPCRK